jgi:hypothetical protein
MMNLLLTFVFTGLSLANDALLIDPSITSTITTAPDGSEHTLIPMVMTDLTGLPSTTTVTTTITEAINGELVTPTHDIAVQPQGIWWRDGLLGPPIPIPTFAITPGEGQDNDTLVPPIINVSAFPAVVIYGEVLMIE